MIRTGDGHNDGVREVVLDRPDSRNALTRDGLDELEAAVADQRKD